MKKRIKYLVLGLVTLAVLVAVPVLVWAYDDGSTELATLSRPWAMETIRAS